MFPHKKINSIQKTVMQKMKDKTRYKAYRKQWENDGIKFLFINHFKCKQIKLSIQKRLAELTKIIRPSCMLSTGVPIEIQRQKHIESERMERYSMETVTKREQGWLNYCQTKQTWNKKKITRDKKVYTNKRFATARLCNYKHSRTTDHQNMRGRADGTGGRNTWLYDDSRKLRQSTHSNGQNHETEENNGFTHHDKPPSSNRHT